VTRENLIEAIYASDSEWSCPIYKGCIHNCRKCAENQLEQYEKAIYGKGYEAGVKAKESEEKK
jgi:hypothetical protein